MRRIQRFSLALFVLALASTAIKGCRPPPDGCEAGNVRCHNDVPQVCSGARYWSNLSDAPCGPTHVCAVGTGRFGGTTASCVRNE